MDLSSMYWEDYDDQKSEDFEVLSYTSLSGDFEVVPVEKDLAKQVAEIYRKNGRAAGIRVYRKEA